MIRHAKTNFFLSAALPAGLAFGKFMVEATLGKIAFYYFLFIFLCLYVATCLFFAVKWTRGWLRSRAR